MTPKPQSTDPSRRQVLCGLAIALIAPGALAACGDGGGSAGSAGSTTTAGPPPTTGGAGSTGSSGGSAGGSALAKLSDVPVGGGTLVDSPSGKVLVVQPTAGTVKAYNPTCPHQGTTVNAPQDNVITCPNHGSQFDASDGSVKTGPAASPLAEIPVRVQGTDIVLA